ncbi:tumor necrosis factor receptor superfamily member 13C-like [Polyodon spathula]|uniref:tumor necrosis factor receptor superfamily member 13C-like n=1 Tax=Polyodon spathula TaxID=7913 RepID=UPI001B7F6438|nr:tumor necrosis factor receptor superfamily member 13C-like [Polyodon spathula]
MSTRDCRPPQFWDSLVNECVARHFKKKATTFPQPRSSLTPLTVDRPTLSVESPLHPDPGAALVSVAVLACGSLLAMLVWLVMCRRQTRRQTAGRQNDPEDLAKTPEFQPGVVVSDENETSCPLVNGLPPGTKNQEPPEGASVTPGEPFVCGTGSEVRVGPCDGGLCNSIPLPATELGGSALVTTKTVRNSE